MWRARLAAGPAAPGPYVVLTVSDNGCGMDAETRSRIFEPFFTTKGVGQGHGARPVDGVRHRQAVRRSIEVYSEPGRGTTFKIYLPRVLDAAADGAALTKMAPKASRIAGTILLVEDDDAVAQVAARILRNHGHTVLVARRAADARRFCARSADRASISC